ncbi:MAG: GTP-binding protein [Bacteroidia bacterium]|nr:GTP-binding protein [Bacteroidia bacterium]NNF30690.1 GTP-binding protein [Flavobacteriaceae bacterium]MBT8277265.1 GTP-binding protein [Bacteroidia bacterium]NNJ80790.1 GTP-binding protein [Flavobacteriaceae bacterium]NNK54865.1 GTP-binding protein [Flavobacteriaceae bacterium]
MAAVKKIVLLGHFGVGKTSLVRRYIDSAFSEDYLVTVGVHVKKKEVIVNDEPVTLIIWDIEGNNSIEKARSSYLLGTQGFIYVFDITRQETYESIEEEMAFLQEHHDQVPVCLVGNKSDLFTDEFTKEFFKDPEFESCYFTSAKTGDNVEALFLDLAKRTL